MVRTCVIAFFSTMDIITTILWNAQQLVKLFFNFLCGRCLQMPCNAVKRGIYAMSEYVCLPVRHNRQLRLNGIIEIGLHCTIEGCF